MFSFNLPFLKEIYLIPVSSSHSKNSTFSFNLPLLLITRLPSFLLKFPLIFQLPQSLLMAHSPMFECMIRKNLMENILKVDDNPQMIQALIKVFYHCEVEHSTAYDMYLFGCKYEMSYLKVN